jgi:hypothetical protein
MTESQLLERHGRHNGFDAPNAQPERPYHSVNLGNKLNGVDLSFLLREGRALELQDNNGEKAYFAADGNGRIELTAQQVAATEEKHLPQVLSALQTLLAPQVLATLTEALNPIHPEPQGNLHIKVEVLTALTIIAATYHIHAHTIIEKLSEISTYFSVEKAVNHRRNLISSINMNVEAENDQPHSVLADFRHVNDEYIATFNLVRCGNVTSINAYLINGKVPRHIRAIRQDTRLTVAFKDDSIDRSRPLKLSLTFREKRRGKPKKIMSDRYTLDKGR